MHVREIEVESKISVIIPVYNVEPYLRQCLDSVVNQTYRNLEIIIVDDGSPDNCGRICDEYAAKDDRIRIIHKKNAGVSAARNDGMKIASGEWTTFVDADDWLDLDYFDRMVSSMPEEKPDIFSSGGYIAVYPERQVLRYLFETPFFERGKAIQTVCVAKTLTKRYGTDGKSDLAAFATCWNRLYRTGFLQENDFRFDVGVHPMEDVLFHLNVFSKAQAIGGCTYIGYHYRQDVASSALRRFNPSWPEMFFTCVNHISEFVETWPEPALLEEALHARIMKLSIQLFRCYFFHAENPKPYRVLSREIAEYKKNPIVSRTLRQKSNRYMDKREILLKYLLRLPMIWPIRVVYIGKDILRGIRK